jgi:hypothetical protein
VTAAGNSAANGAPKFSTPNPRSPASQLGLPSSAPSPSRYGGGLHALEPKARDQLGKQLNRQYGKVLEEYDVLDRALKKFAKLREMLVALSRHMEKNKLVRKGDHDDYSFPYPLDKHWTAGPARSYTYF